MQINVSPSAAHLNSLKGRRGESVAQNILPNSFINMDRVTKTTLELAVSTLNKKLGNDSIRLDHTSDPRYSGYCLADKNYSLNLTPRMSGREMRQYLRGAVDWVA
jgi:hypothetical protein